ncbi:acyl-CoA dehydrogenase [Acrocarpospora pleiomorpha]|uniref:Acyl-CoA dehydrogenase n=1 Tax=Acrocarpospora pleiomorpha TaxID=90975 RepID=A0A5M3XHF5_9ACTN|nr:acyl-CoA dehydrogenase [Acrocarpospora pleiomorpha]GES17518.1 acyl-CoA dehydrogenase [Acrocarpospora pleiomorpha]
MTWRGPTLDADQLDLLSMLQSLAGDRDLTLTDTPDVVHGLVTALAELGVWTLGTEESYGGGGADAVTTAVAWTQLGRSWPALGWASVQAHAAVDVVGPEARCAQLVGTLHTGAAAVAVVDASSPHVRLAWDGDILRGTVDRVDAASEEPHLLVLDGPGSALSVRPSALTTTALRRTGLGGALTRSARVEAGSDDVVELRGVDADRARARLHRGAALVAAGIASAAVDAATAYAAERHQFGDALTALPTVRQSLLEQAAGASVALTAALDPLTDPIRALAAAREACDGAVEVAAAALQSHGGYGYLTEYPAERLLRDAVSLRAAVDLHGAAVRAARLLVGRPDTDTLHRKAS